MIKTNVNILTTVEHLLPGDNWTENEWLYVITDVKPSTQKHYTTVTYTAIKDNNVAYLASHDWISTTNFVADRPKP